MALVAHHLEVLVFVVEDRGGLAFDVQRWVGEGCAAELQLHLFVVAEGVETAEHARTVMDANVDFLQGYHLYRPVPAAEFTTVLAQHQPFKVAR